MGGSRRRGPGREPPPHSSRLRGREDSPQPQDLPLLRPAPAPLPPACKREKPPQTPPSYWALPRRHHSPAETRRARGASAPGPCEEAGTPPMITAAHSGGRRRCLCFQLPHDTTFRAVRLGVCLKARFHGLPDQPHGGRCFAGTGPPRLRTALHTGCSNAASLPTLTPAFFAKPLKGSNAPPSGSAAPPCRIRGLCCAGRPNRACCQPSPPP